MAFVSECPSCGQKLKIPDNLVGKSVKCSKCGNVFTAQAFTESPPPAPQQIDSYVQRPSRSDEDEVEAQRRPRNRNRQRASDGGETAGRGGLLTGFGIASIALPILAICVNVIAGLVLPPLGICSLIFVIAGLVLGIMAWVMSKGDLNRIRAGVIDRSAEGGTKTGYVTGIIGTILNALYFVCSCIVIIILLAVGGAFAAAVLGNLGKTTQRAPVVPPVKRASWTPIPNIWGYLPDRGKPTAAASER